MITYLPGEIFPVTTAYEGLVWPAVPATRQGLITSLLAQLQSTEFFSAEQLARLQWLQLSNLLLHARRASPYYANLPVVTPGGLTEELWRQVPLLSRSALQANGERLPAPVPKGHGRTGPIVTSGSTGQPVKVLQTEATQALWTAFTLRDMLWHKRDFTARLAAIRYLHKGSAEYPQGASSKGWGAISGVAGPLGEAFSLDIKTPLDQQLEWLGRVKPRYLVTFPSNLHYLAERCRERGMTLDGLEGVSTLSEVLRPATRVLTRQVLGVEIQDMYSAQEVGYIAIQCPEHEHYHVMSEGVFVEILNDADAPCAPGEVGRVVVTSLLNFATPLLRYDIGDYAEVGEPCPCGRGLPVLKRVLGRTRNSLRLPDGQRVWTQFGTMEIVEALPVKAVQLVQESLSRVVLRLAVERPLTPEQQQVALGILRGHLPYPFEVGVEEVAELPRSQSGKFEDLVSRVDQGPLVS